MINTPRRPRDRKTAAQLAARARLRAAAAAYARLDDEEKRFWTLEAQRVNITSGRNCYLRAYLLGDIVSVYGSGTYGMEAYGSP